jgi:DNA-binding XRE family transcriptional regulator
MSAFAVQLENAERMMTRAEAREAGIEIQFADGCRGTVPYSAIPEIGDFSKLSGMQLPNPYEIVLKNREGETVELPWDFGRNYCDSRYRPRIEKVAAAGRQALGKRIRSLREASHLTQARLAEAAGIGRVTLVRIEKGEQSPKFETLVALARGLEREASELLLPAEA